MIRNTHIGVVVPAYNEQARIHKVVQTIPEFVDLIVVVDDASTDTTAQIIQEECQRNPRVHFIHHEKNRGVGASISSGYKYLCDRNMDVAAVLAGDGQMDPSELHALCLPIIEEKVDYVKGNRLIYADAWKIMPKYRFIGNSILSLLTKIASGYWFLTDTQTGYTALSLDAVKRLDLASLYPRYGFPNDILVKLNVVNARIKEIPIKPVYHPDGKSGIKLWHVIPRISWLLAKDFF
ncbi:MAG: glycosyltransferase family 2 protein, partial [Parcubacteria group bacterium]